MAKTDRALEDYLTKLMEVRYQTGQEVNLGEDELKKVALEVGLSEQEWENTRQQGRDLLTSGKTHLSTYNWSDAVNNLEQAAHLLPDSSEAAALAGKAYLRRGDANSSTEDLSKAEYQLERALKIKPVFSEAYPLKSELNRLQATMTGMTSKKKNRSSLIKWGIPLVALLVLVFWLISSYNRVISAEENTLQAWAQVENVYQRRADLVPNLVETVKGAANFEQETLNQVIRARSEATSIQIDASSMDQANLAEFSAKQADLSASLGRLLAVAENYPALKSLDNFRDLQAQLEGTENRITVERKRFNESVQQYNAMVRRFPNSMLGFQPRPYFSTEPANQKVPEINF